MNLCLYYQAEVERARCWLFVACLRSFEHLAFDRTLDATTSTFEFYVPPLLAKQFENIMHEFAAMGLISNLRQLDNRLGDPEAIL